MTDYRKILRLMKLGLNHSQIAVSMGISRQTAITVLQRSAEQEVNQQIAEGLSDRELAALLFSTVDGRSSYKMPDYDCVHMEMIKSGVTL